MLENRNEICNLYEKYADLLAQSQKQAIYLYYFEDLSLREIANELAQSHSAVQNAIKKGINKLKLINDKVNI